ncbi:DNA repair protein RecN (Recombination protein N) [Thermonema lapsum]|uniref:DNA repair protein RecN n=1 Tax=Thermonema lapsum TaxID=28195 RepID=A0A846MNY9_9BACT|nr:DNA repair protein RecN [Thermonema lapsum]NIK73298.1 DNA repair protein RecN (Recombination protein N) [Thermonema lapsum]
MLIHLSIRNYALIEQLEMRPHPGLNVITGETGAGKSIMLGAIGLLLGERADKRALMNETEKCIVEATFDLTPYHLEALFDTYDLDYQDLTIIRREISPAGKSRAFINDTPVTLDVLKILGRRLIDIHSQHDHLLLGDDAYQLALLDTFAGNDSLLDEYRRLFTHYRSILQRYEQLKQQIEQQEQALDYERFLWQELQNAALEEGEQEQLEQRLEKLEHAEAIQQAAAEALQALENEEYGAESVLSVVVEALKRLRSYSEDFGELYERAESVLIEVRELSRDIANAVEEVEINPREVQRIQERLDLLYSLQKKHKVHDEAQLIRRKQELERRIEQASVSREELEALEQEIRKQKQQLHDLAMALRAQRQAQAKALAEALVALLQDMAMPHATVQVQVLPCEALYEEGLDKLQLLFSANKGIAPGPLKEVASGGEFSRLMLAIKYLLAQKTALPTLILDEIDTGISGETAMKVARMMAEMSKHHQLIAITHLHQIAALADAHYYVYKDEAGSRTFSRLKLLSVEERVHEIAQMISGQQPSPSALQSARELLAQNRRP